MPTFRWTGGAGDFNPNTAGNWESGAVPGNGDDVIVSRGTKINGFNHSAKTFASVYITRQFPGENIGDDANPWQFNATNVFIEAGANVQLVKLNGTLGTVRVVDSGQGSVIIAGGTTTNLYATGRGLTKIASGATLTNGRVGDDAVVYLGPLGGAVAATLLIAGGRSHVYSERDIATARVASWMQMLGVDARVSAELLIRERGYFNYRAKSANAFPLVEVEAFGEFDPTGMMENQTITSLIRWPNAKVGRASGGATVAVTGETFVGAEAQQGGQGFSL
jgi:hypothetical protein